MRSLSCSNVVDQMVRELAQRRRAAVSHRGAYLALARAILSSGEASPEAHETERDVDSLGSDQPRAA